MNNIKRLSIALIALGLSAPAFADCTFDVTVPNQQGGFTFGADGLYLRPSSSSTGFDVVDTTSVVTPSPNLTVINTDSNIRRLDPKYHWGFDIVAGYRFPCTGNDIMATWTHLNDTRDSETTVTAPFSVPGFNLTSYASDSSTQFRYDAVDLNFGQKVNFGSDFLFRMFAGARIAELKQDLNTTINSSGITTGVITPTSVTNTTTIDQSSKFQGVGPEIGIEGRYCIGAGFGADASLLTSILIGKLDNDLDIQDTQTTVFPGATPSTIVANTHRTNDFTTHGVPTVDINVGLDYTYNFNNCSRSSLVIQAGYKVVHYWDVIHLSRSGRNDSGNGNGGLSNDSGVNFTSNVNFDGPYLGFKVNL